ncbi:MAG: peptide ligase PGM1-related protein [Actinomycetota bacterium]|nr:peptide ligase PGM1-related protein [Actinomycetota bacterium]
MKDLQSSFEELQRKLVPLWRSIGSINDDEQTIVVVPSISGELNDSLGGSGQVYEERFLFLLFLLRQPSARLIYVTGKQIDPDIVDYYLDLLPGVISTHARKRLHLVSPLDGNQIPLSKKLLQRPRLIEHIKQLIPDPDRAHLIPYNTTELERDLAVALGIPMYGADPKHFHLGSKSGCRRLFEELGVKHPLGAENLHSLDDLVGAIDGLRAQRPTITEVLVKSNEGAGGMGNALIDLRGLPEPGPASAEAVTDRIMKMRFDDPSTPISAYLEDVQREGGIVEERIKGDDFRSPSVQLRVTPLGDLEILSTHDQLLGGPSGQTYLGCVFPADPGYAVAITDEARKVGERLAKEGVIGRFALDFVTVKKPDGSWDSYAIEINLRKGGTTHPFLTLQFLTNGDYDAATATFTTASGRSKCFVASDHVESHAYKGLSPEDLFDIAVKSGLHFDHTRQTGIVYHMISSISTEGRTGITAVGDSPEDARMIYQRALSAIDEAAEGALIP